MKPDTIKSILDAHGIPYYEENGNIFADSMINGTTLFEEVENVTTWTRYQLFTWLGY